jgi:hypothetical protein
MGRDVGEGREEREEEDWLLSQDIKQAWLRT